MKRNILTYILSYIVVIIIAIIYTYLGMRYDLGDGVMFYIFYGTLFCVPIVVFFLAGKLYLVPTNNRKTDLSVFYPAFLLFPAIMIYYIASPDKDTEYVAMSLLMIALITIFPSFFMWLGMMCNKKKFFRKKEYRESNEWNQNEW